MRDIRIIFIVDASNDILVTRNANDRILFSQFDAECFAKLDSVCAGLGPRHVGAKLSLDSQTSL